MMKDPPFHIVMLPSVSGGIGHISRTATLARMLRRLDPTVQIEYVLDADRLRPFNLDATLRMGFRPRLLAPRTRESRDAIVRACFGEADVIVDDVARYLFPLRRVVPRAAWISILMHPVGDELFMDWPLLAQMDALIWAYPPLVGIPSELEPVAAKLVQTGPFLDIEDVPDKAAARGQLGLAADEQVVVYAPRGFPFGKDFGHRMLASVYGAVEALRGSRWPRLRLVLLAVSDAAELRGVEELPAELADWVTVQGVVTPAEALIHARAADILIGEGTSTMHEGAALRTPLVLVPGPIQEATLLGTRLGQEKAAHAFTIDTVTADLFARTFEAVLTRGEEREAMTERAFTLVTGGGGVAAAARLVLEVAAGRRALSSER